MDTTNIGQGQMEPTNLAVAMPDDSPADPNLLSDLQAAIDKVLALVTQIEDDALPFVEREIAALHNVVHHVVSAFANLKAKNAAAAG